MPLPLQCFQPAAAGVGGGGLARPVSPPERRGRGANDSQTRSRRCETWGSVCHDGLFPGHRFCAWRWAVARVGGGCCLPVGKHAPFRRAGPEPPHVSCRPSACGSEQGGTRGAPGDQRDLLKEATLSPQGSCQRSSLNSIYCSQSGMFQLLLMIICFLYGTCYKSKYGK